MQTEKQHSSSLMERGKVSVIIPSYNHARFVKETIEGVWNQTYRPVELVVVDDASTDESPRILKALQAESPVPFALELFHVTGDEEYLHAARRACDHFGARLDEIQGSGLYVGLGGIAFMFTLLWAPIPILFRSTMNARDLYAQSPPFSTTCSAVPRSGRNTGNRK